MRPIYRYGRAPEGVQRYLYSISDDGRLALNRPMVAASYGLSLDRFNACLDQLLATGAIVDETPAPIEGFTRRTELFWVAEPAGLEAEEEPPAKRAPVAEETPDPVDPYAEFDFMEHEHPRRRGKTVEMVPHYHAYGSIPHTHMLRAVCTREECAGVDTHNIHPGPEED